MSLLKRGDPNETGTMRAEGTGETYSRVMVWEEIIVSRFQRLMHWSEEPKANLWKVGSTLQIKQFDECAAMVSTTSSSSSLLKEIRSTDP
jgi:hypothetical protein